MREATHREGTPSSSKTRYLRWMGETIGWDNGEDAPYSYAECSAGITEGRAYHGRPTNDVTAQRLGVEQGG